MHFNVRSLIITNVIAFYSSTSFDCFKAFREAQDCIPYKHIFLDIDFLTSNVMKCKCIGMCKIRKKSIHSFTKKIPKVGLFLEA